MNPFIFKPGYCLACGKQSMVRNFSGALIKGLVGTKLCWLCLLDGEGRVQTRVGTITICKDHILEELDCEQLKQNLIDSPFSGVKNEPEFAMFPRMILELIKTYGT